eukprot:Clim_evm61s156 gene=Clim_evmTU61s156
MSRQEFISPDGLRLDGRRPQELRRFECKLGVFQSDDGEVDGSAYLEQGNTKIICIVAGPKEASAFGGDTDRLTVSCELSVARFSSMERLRRSGKGGKRSRELELAIEQTFNGAILTHLYPRTKVNIYIEILQSDGGIRAAAINAASLALISSGVPMKDIVAACSASILDGQPVIDLNYMEEGSGGPNLVVSTLPSSKKLVGIHMESRVHSTKFPQVLNMAIQGCLESARLMQKALRADAEVKIGRLNVT